MQDASTEFLETADSSLRTPIGKLEITWSDAIIEPITSAVSSDDNRGSQNLQVADTINTSSYKYTILDGTWELNQDYHLAPETADEIANYQIGFYNNTICAATAPYAFPSPIVLTVNFSSRTIKGIMLTGDTMLNEYPTNFTIQIYSGVTLLYTKNETANTQLDVYYAGQYNNVDKLVLTINNWSAPSTVCKITEFFTSFVTTLTGSDIINMDLIEEREIRDATLPVGNMSANELSFTIQNFNYGYGEWKQAGEVVLVKSDVQDVTTWSVFAIVNNASGVLIDTYTCPHELIYGVDTWTFNYYYTISSGLSTNDVIKLYFLPSGADTGKPGAFESQEWMIQDVIYEPYTPLNPTSPFSNVILPNRKIKAYLGFLLPSGAYDYKQIGTFWNNDWVVDEKQLTLSTDSRDRLGLLRDSIYKGSPLFEGASLYYIANTVLTYAKTNIPMNDLQWEIDSGLSTWIIPYAFFGKISYFEVLEILMKACLGQCYMSKDDVLILDSYTKNLIISAPTTFITKNEYYDLQQTFSYREILNKINVNYFVYELQSSTMFYETEALEIDASETLTDIEIEFTSFVKDSTIVAAVGTTTGGITISIDSEIYYTWGAIITVSETSGNAGTFTLQFTGVTLELQDTLTISTSDTQSIADFSEREYDFPDNNLVQSKSVATIIGNALIDTYADPRSDIEINYAGNPVIELADTMRVTVYKRDTDNIKKDFIIYKSELNFDGTLTGRLYGKKQTYYGELLGTIQDSDNASSTNVYQDTDGATLQWQDTDN